jgi:putative transposase
VELSQLWEKRRARVPEEYILRYFHVKLVTEYGYTAHIKSRGEENIRIEIPGFRARRWVVERTHSWLNRFRRLFIRWEKKIENYLAMIHFACAWITFRAAGLFG